MRRSNASLKRLFPPLYSETTKGHGRVETRSIQVAPIGKRSFFPFAKQAIRVERVRTLKGETSTEIVWLITSLSPQKASPEMLLAINRGHWEVENKFHYVRDVSLNEDRRHHRKNPQLFAVLNNLAISLCRLCGNSFMPSFQRVFRAQPSAAMRVLGMV